MSEITWKVGGVDGTRWRVQRASMWRPPVVVRRSSVEVPGRHGAIQAGKVVFGEPTVSLEFQPLGYGDQDDLEVAVNDLTAILAAPTLDLTRVSGDLVTSAPAALVSISHDLFVVGTIARIVVVLAIPGVFLREAAKASDPVSPVSGTFPLPLLAGSTAPIPDAAIRIIGPATSVTLTDPRTLTGLSWTGTLAAGENLFLRAAELRANLSTSTSAWAGGGSDVSGGLDYPAAGPLVLQPRTDTSDPSVRTVELKAAATGTTSSTALVVRVGRSFL